MKTALRAAATSAAVISLGLLTSVHAYAGSTLSLDPDHTTAAFSVQHLSISNVTGSIPVTSSSITLNERSIPKSIRVSLDATGIDTRDAHRDSDLKTDKWFDIAKYPSMTFVSSVITPGVDNTFTADGILTIHGVSKPVTLQGSYHGKGIDPMGRTHFGYEASTTIHRTDFGVGQAPAWMVGDNIAITINAEVLK